jgi:hypothetical protein
MGTRILDIFNNDAFAVTTMIDPVEKMPTIPGFLGSLGMFRAEPVDTDTVAIGYSEGTVSLIRTTLRAAPIEVAAPETKNIRDFRIPRIAKGDKIFAHELRNIVNLPGDVQLDRVATMLARKQQRLKQDVEYTKEFHMLGAVQGLLLDADGSTLVDFYDEWDIAAPSEIDMDLPTLTDGALRERIRDSISRPLQRAVGTGAPVGRIIGLAGDDFFDALVKNPEVRDTYKGWQAAAELRGNADKPFDTFTYGNVEWINFQGSDNSDIRIDPLDAVIFPTGVPGMFRHVMGPGESLELVGQEGRDVYPLIVRDVQRDMWVQPEIYAYPLMLNTRPDLVLRATVGA